jgi:hypothetical protein
MCSKGRKHCRQAARSRWLSQMCHEELVIESHVSPSLDPRLSGQPLDALLPCGHGLISSVDGLATQFAIADTLSIVSEEQPKLELLPCPSERRRLPTESGGNCRRYWPDSTSGLVNSDLRRAHGCFKSTWHTPGSKSGLFRYPRLREAGFRGH